MRFVALFAFILAAFMLGAGAAAATPLAGWKRNAEWSQEPRTLEVTSDARGFAFESQRSSQAADDVLVGQFDLLDAEYRLELRNRSGDGAVQTFRIAFSRVIEFRDTDGDGSYEATDATLDAWELDAAIVPRLQDAKARDGSHRIVARYPFGTPVGDGSAQPALELRFHLSPHTRSLAGVPVPPTETKFDITLANMPQNASDSQLAVEFQVVSETPTRLGPEALETESGEYRFALTWQPTATVDGVSRHVGVSVVEASETTSGVYFSYARGATIVHDPQVGAHQYETTAFQPIVEVFSKGSPFLYAMGVLGAAAIVGTLTFRRARRRA